MPSIAQKYGKPPINWWKVCTEMLLAKKAGKLDEREFKRYEQLASDWHTCAAAQVDSRVPHNIESDSIFAFGTNPWPRDAILANEGTRFVGSFSSKDFAACFDCIRHITARERIILNESR